jgi:hypothetical protein
MAAVYKTLSATSGNDKEPGERKNKQRVLILVRYSSRANVGTHTC